MLASARFSRGCLSFVSRAFSVFGDILDLRFRCWPSRDYVKVKVKEFEISHRLLIRGSLAKSHPKERRDGKRNCVKLRSFTRRNTRQFNGFPATEGDNVP